MKQEMQGQMAFQNKIRALKQIELSKYGGKEGVHGASSEGQGSCTDDADGHAAPASTGIDEGLVLDQLSETVEQEMFWNPEDDDQIFDFLMEN